MNKRLEIQDEGVASNTFVQMMFGNFEWGIKNIRKDLLEYCKMDTFVMVNILEKLKTI